MCGREHAVVKGKMSKHGYTVEGGWFNGVCAGDSFPPMQVSRSATDNLVVDVRAQCVALREQARQLEEGTVLPIFVVRSTFKNGKSGKEYTPFAEAVPYDQKQQIQRDIWSADNRADIGDAFANDMSRLVDEVHGKPLREVDVTANKPTPINPGEVRYTPAGRKLTVTSIKGARIYCLDQDEIRTWVSSTAWRKYSTEAPASQ